MVYTSEEYRSIFKNLNIETFVYIGEKETELKKSTFRQILIAESDKYVIIRQDFTRPKPLQIGLTSLNNSFLKLNSLLFEYEHWIAEKCFKFSVHDDTAADKISFQFIAAESYEFFIYQINSIDNAKNFEISKNTVTSCEEASKHILNFDFNDARGTLGSRIFDSECFVTSGVKIYRLSEDNCKHLKDLFDQKFAQFLSQEYHVLNPVG